MNKISPLPEPLEGEVLTVNVDGWEGPLDLLLTLARAQKVDLREISILALTEQYLAFIENMQKLRLELAADYLVMAAWLAYLKSSLLLPKAEQEVPNPEEMAIRLQMRLQRLHAMREAGFQLMERDRMGRNVFVRPCPEGLNIVKKSHRQGTFYELIDAYARMRHRTAPVVHMVATRPIITLDEAIQNVSAQLDMAIDWTMLERFLPHHREDQMARSSLASNFVAALELARQGRIELRQDDSFAPIFLRRALNRQ